MKSCKACNKIKPLTEFYKEKENRDGRKNVCISCSRLRYKKYWKKNRDRFIPIKRFYKLANKDKIVKQRKSKYYLDKMKFPWRFVFWSLYNRCTNSKHEHYKYYGGRGIKCRISIDEVKLLWIRDDAERLKNPDIDRIDNDGNYTFENCRFIEHIDNVKRR